MSKKAYSVWDNPSNTKPSPAPPAKSKKKQKQTVGVPQGQQPKAPAQKASKKAESTIPMDRQLYREVLEAQNAVPQHPESKTPKQFVEKPLDRQEQGNLELLNRKQQEPLPQQKQTQPQEKQTIPRQKQTLPQWNQKRPDALRKADEGYETEEERRQRELEEEESRREEREAMEKEAQRMREEAELEYQRYLEYMEEQRRQEERRERWNGFGEQFQDILEKGGNALAGEWNSFWNYMTGKDWMQTRKDFGDYVREEVSDTINFFKDPFASIGNFFAGEAPSTDSEYLQKMAKKGSVIRDMMSDPMSFLANYLTGEAAVTDGEELQRAAERGRENAILNFSRYYIDSLAGGALGAADSLFGKQENGWLANSRKELMEDAQENYDRLINSTPPFLRGQTRSVIASVDLLADALFSMTGNVPAGLPRATRTFGKAKDEAEKKGYSPGVQTAYALGKTLREYFQTRTEGYGLNDNDRGFLQAFGDYVSQQKEIIEVIEKIGKNRFPDLLESILMLVEPGIDRVLNGTEEPDIKEIPDIFDDMVDGLLDQVEEKADAWQKEAWEPKKTLPEEIWGLSEYDYDGETERSLLPAAGETDAETLWDLPEETENAGNPEENWYTEDEEKRIPPQGPLPSNTTYLAGEFGYEYETDSQGRLASWHAPELQLTERTGRLPYVHNTPGKQPGDHAGHLAGDRFGGSGQLDNLVSQYWLVNLSSYKKLENEWYKAIQAGKTVEVDVQVEYDGDDLRPSIFYIKYFIDGEEYSQRITNDIWGGLGL